MQTTVNSAAAEQKRKLYKKFVKGPHGKYNAIEQDIDFIEKAIAKDGN